MQVEVAAEVGELDQRGQLALSRRFEFAQVLAQLRGDVLVAEELVELLLAARLEDLAGLDLLDAVFGDREAAPDRILAKGDVVVLRAGEMLQQISVQPRGDDTEVETQAVVRDHRRLRLAPGRDPLDPAELREVIRQRARLGRRRDDVEITEGFLPPPDAAGLRDLERGRMLTKHRDDRLDGG